VAEKSKRPARPDLKNPDGKFGRLIQIGGTAIVVIFAVALVLYIVTKNHADKSPVVTGEGDTVRITSAKLVTKPGSADPKAVVTFYEDFLCPNCAAWEAEFGPTVSKLIDIGAIAADYSMLAILDHPPFDPHRDYSSRAGGAALCVADESKDIFRRFHSEMFSPGIQPSEKATSFPDNAWLVERARQAGVNVGPGSKVADCIKSGKYADKVAAEAPRVKIFATPTITVNGEKFSPQSPQDLVAKIKSIVGDVPGIDQAVAPPAA
jgi:protein-disulfide isomerase